MSRRSQTTRHFGRPSQLLQTDDLGVLREGDETEDVLRRQLLEREREIDKVSPRHPLRFLYDERAW